jgi:hypothetical protein
MNQIQQEQTERTEMNSEELCFLSLAAAAGYLLFETLRIFAFEQ